MSVGESFIRVWSSRICLGLGCRRSTNCQCQWPCRSSWLYGKVHFHSSNLISPLILFHRWYQNGVFPTFWKVNSIPHHMSHTRLPSSLVPNPLSQSSSSFKFSPKFSIIPSYKLSVIKLPFQLLSSTVPYQLYQPWKHSTLLLTNPHEQTIRHHGHIRSTLLVRS